MDREPMPNYVDLLASQSPVDKAVRRSTERFERGDLESPTLRVGATNSSRRLGGLEQVVLTTAAATTSPTPRPSVATVASISASRTSTSRRGRRAPRAGPAPACLYDSHQRGADQGETGRSCRSP